MRVSPAEIAAFLPRYLAEKEPCSEQVITCAGPLLFADVSGFTALTEKLGKIGPEGAEELTARVNQFFEVLLEVLASYDAEVLKFGGDALLIGFNDSSGLPVAVDCACALAGAAERAGRLKTPAGRFHLRLHIGLSPGPYHELVCGRSQERREHFIFGRVVHQCQNAANLAQPGEVVIAEPSPQLQTDRALVCLPDVPEFYRLDLSQAPLRTVNRAKIVGQPWSEAGPWCGEFLDPAVVFLIREKHPDWRGEHRAVTVVFVFLSGSEHWPQELAGRTFGSLLETVESLRKKWGGTWSRSDPGSAYQKLLFLFGAPTAGERDPERAVGFVLELCDRLRALRTGGVPLDFGIGAATGRVFGGFVGGQNRREYTVMGDAINLAARLASRSLGDGPLVDEVTAHAAGERYGFESMEKVKLKGKTAETALYRPTGQAEIAPAETNRETAEYYPQLREEVCALLRGRSPETGCGVMILGEAGYGKTTLARRALEQLFSLGVKPRVIPVAMWPEEEAIPFFGVAKLLTEVYRHAGGENQDLRRAFQTTWPSTIDPGWQSLFAEVLGLAHRPSPLVRGLDPPTRLQRLAELLPMVVSALVTVRPCVVIIDNYQWLDPSSRSVLQVWWDRIGEFPVWLVAITRESCDLKKLENSSPNLHVCHLAGVEETDLVRLITARFPGIEPPRRLIEELISRARSVPAVADAHLEHWAGHGFLQRDMRNPRRLQVEDLTSEDLPDALLAAYVQRVDALAHPASAIVRAAAIWGGTATLAQLSSLLSSRLPRPELQTAAERLERLDYLQRSGGMHRPVFSLAHPLLAQAAYQTMSFAERRAGHARAARWWERHRGRGRAAILARHYAAAGDVQRAVPAMLSAAREAAPVGAYMEARAFLRSARALFSRRADMHLKIEVDTELARVEQELGNYEPARRLFGLALKRGEQLRQSEQGLMLRLALGRLYWIAGRYHQCQTVIRGILSGGVAKANRRVQGWARYLQGELWRRRGQFGKAEQSLELALRDFAAVNERRGLLDARNALGIVCWNQGQLALAARWFKAALSLGPGVVDLSSRARLFNNLGILSQERASLRRARRYYERALETFTQLGHRRNCAYCLGNLANIDRLGARFDSARESYEEVLRETEAIGEAHAHAYTLGNLGDLYADFGAGDRALPYYRRALAFARRAGDNELTAETLMRLAVVARSHGNPARFVEHLAQGAGFAKQAGSLEFQIKAELLAASDMHLQGDYSSAAIALRVVAKQAKEARLVLYQVLAHEELARLDLSQGEPRRAQRHARAGLRLAEKAGYALPELRLHILIAIAEAPDSTANSPSNRIKDDSRRHRERADEIMQRILSDIADETIRAAFLRQEDVQQLCALTQRASMCLCSD